VWKFYDDRRQWANRAPLYPLFVAGVRYVPDARRPFRRFSRRRRAARSRVSCRGDRCADGRERARRSSRVARCVVAVLRRHGHRLVEHVFRALVVCRFSRLARTPIVRRRSALRRRRDGGPRDAARLTFASTAAFLLRGCALRRRARPPLCSQQDLRRAGALGDPNHAPTAGLGPRTDGGARCGSATRKRRSTAFPPSRSTGRSECSRDSPRRLERAARKNGDESAGAVFRRALSTRSPRPVAPRGADCAVRALWSPLMTPWSRSAPEGRLLLFGFSSLALWAGAFVAAARAPRMPADLPAVSRSRRRSLSSRGLLGQSRYWAPASRDPIAAIAAALAPRFARRGNAS